MPGKPSFDPKRTAVLSLDLQVSAFAGTDLDAILRANDISTVVLLGIATSGVVLSTMPEAVDRDYQVVVIRDCCTDVDKDTHACLVNRLFPT